MKKVLIYFGVAIFVTCVGFAGFYWGQSLRSPPDSSAAPPSMAQRDKAQNEVDNSIGQKSSTNETLTQVAIQDTSPVPKLNDSDAPVEAHLIDIISKEQFEALFNTTDVLRKFVVTIYNAAESRIPNKLSIFKPLDGDFIVSNDAGVLTISPKNYTRYSQYVDLINSVDTEKVVTIYSHYYQLLQEAYHELGADGEFNDRLVAVIDNVLSTPTVKEPIKLERLGYYEFADQDLESRSVAQKILLRMGPANAAHIKKKLRAIRRRLIHLKLG